MNQGAAQAKFLPHAAGELPGRPGGERREAGAEKQFHDAPVALFAVLAEKPAEKFDVLADAKIGIEILSETLRHVRDARTSLVAVRSVRHIAAEHMNVTFLDCLGARHQRQQCRFADAVGANQRRHPACRNGQSDIVQRQDRSVAMPDFVQPGNGPIRICHCTIFDCSQTGHAIERSNRIYATPGNPVRTSRRCERNRS